MDPASADGAAPDTGHRPTLRRRDAVAITVGIVVGAGIFRTPGLIAGAAASEAAVLLAWVAGGLISLVGALCYAELAAAYPHAGGDYHYLVRAFGKRLAFLYAWARLSVVQTGSLALLAYVFGDYASEILNLGPLSPAIWAGLVVVAITAVNWVGVHIGARAQNWLTAVEVLGLVTVIVAGLVFAPEAAAAPAPATATNFGLIMVFVLLTFGGWNEAVFVSAELKDVRRNIAPVLVFSLLLITALYLLANLAYLRALGLAGVAGSQAVAADVLQRAFGAGGAVLISILIAVAALTSANATAITGARSAYALGRDHRFFSYLGQWNDRTASPGNALLVQGAAALALVAVGAFARDGFRLAVEFTAPVFWFFFLLVGVALIRLRMTEPDVVRPFRVPLYPVLPLIFCCSTAYLLYSSLAYTGLGALAGVAVVAAGALFLIPWRRTAPAT